MEFSLEVFGWYSIVAIILFWLLFFRKPTTDLMDLSMTQLMNLMRSKGAQILEEKTKVTGDRPNARRLERIERMQNEFQAMQLELGQRAIHADGKASQSDLDYLYQVLEVRAMNANCRNDIQSECMQKFFALPDGEMYELQPNGGVVRLSSPDDGSNPGN